MKKITFVGDIMCEEPLLRASKRGNTFDFHNVFEDCKSFFEQSDYVVGNLETICAGETEKYTNSIFSFNTPDEFVVEMAASGINMVTTATNHALDRNKAGLFRTLALLDSLGIEHIGAYKTEDDRKRIFVKEFDEKKVAFLNYTYGTNFYESPFVIEEDEYFILNMLMPQERVSSKKSKGFRSFISKVLYKVVPLKSILRLKKIFGREYTNRYTDKIKPDLLKESYIIRVENDVKEARRLADIVIVCMHIGGQFNEFPGELVEYFNRKISDFGADYLVNTHAHVVQKVDSCGKTFIANCLGNFSISPSSIYVPRELKPDYSIALHLYVGDTDEKVAFSILKVLEDRKHRIRVVPVYELSNKLFGEEYYSLQKDVSFIYNRFLGKKETLVPIQMEYLVEV